MSGYLGDTRYSERMTTGLRATKAAVPNLTHFASRVALSKFPNVVSLSFPLHKVE